MRLVVSMYATLCHCLSVSAWVRWLLKCGYVFWLWSAIVRYLLHLERPGDSLLRENVSILVTNSNYLHPAAQGFVWLKQLKASIVLNSTWIGYVSHDQLAPRSWTWSRAAKVLVWMRSLAVMPDVHKLCFFLFGIWGLYLGCSCYSFLSVFSEDDSKMYYDYFWVLHSFKRAHYLFWLHLRENSHSKF